MRTKEVINQDRGLILPFIIMNEKYDFDMD